MDVYSLLYTLYVIPPAILTLVIKLPSARLAALASSFAFLLNVKVSFQLYKIEHVNIFYLLENIRPMYHRAATWDGLPVTLSSA
jgi:hypothetical protein